MSGASPKRKGDRLERQLVTTLKAHGLQAKRIPLSGADPNFPGDVQVTVEGKTWLLECKSRKDFKTLYGWLEHRDALILKGDRREALCVVPLRTMLGLVSDYA